MNKELIYEYNIYIEYLKVVVVYEKWYVKEFYMRVKMYVFKFY